MSPAGGLDYAGLTALMEDVFGLWRYLEGAGVMDDKAGDMFEAIIARMIDLRELTGWGGVPGEYTGASVPGCACAFNDGSSS